MQQHVVDRIVDSVLHLDADLADGGGEEIVERRDEDVGEHDDHGHGVDDDDEASKRVVARGRAHLEVGATCGEILV